MCIHAKSMENLRMYALNISVCTTVQIYMLHLHVGRFTDFFQRFYNDKNHRHSDVTYNHENELDQSQWKGALILELQNLTVHGTIIMSFIIISLK